MSLNMTTTTGRLDPNEAAGVPKNLKAQEQTARQSTQQRLGVWPKSTDVIESNVRASPSSREPVAGVSHVYGHGVSRSAQPQAGRLGPWYVSLKKESCAGPHDAPVRAGSAPALPCGWSRPACAPQLALAEGEAPSAAAQDAGVAMVHIVETGLNRFASCPRGRLGDAARPAWCGGSAFTPGERDEDKTTPEQHGVSAGCERLPWIPLHHVSSTGALLDLPELRLAMVRCGIGVYGYYPSEEAGRSVALNPALALRSRVARVSEVAPGESVGYGRTWTASRQSRVALVMAGYADGVRRVLSNQGVALVRGHRAPFAGRVAMDMLMLDVTDIPGVAVDDEVTLIGSQGNDTVDADEVGRLSGTISYEVLAGIMARAPALRSGRPHRRLPGPLGLSRGLLATHHSRVRVSSSAP
jgi:alanine racemase